MAPRASVGKVNYAVDNASDSDDDPVVVKNASGKKRKSIVESDDDEDFEMKDASEEEEEEEEEDEEEAAVEEEEEEDEATSVQQVESEEEEEEELMPVVEEPVKKKRAPRKPAGPRSTKAKAKQGIDESLPPIHKIDDIFADMVKRFRDDLKPTLDQLKGRPLRVATMCSGTESPLLALGMIVKALKALFGDVLIVKHLFSAEIEPFKQAYIERNFSPPLLFRDVQDLEYEMAETAYGATVEVPGDIDLLVAGTSCVDYSNLNKKGKGINDGGESGRTFYGMLGYTNRHRPPIVILENVQKAPWEKCIEAFDSIGYEANSVSLDTKYFYIPHTRTRGYLMATPKENKGITKKWAELMADKFRRTASLPLESFLLPNDDPRIITARQELSTQVLKKDGTKKKEVDWNKCEEKHAKARAEDRLGQKRPLTAWQENGAPPVMPDGAWSGWGGKQTERVWDLMDISYLRNALNYVDITYKAAVWNLSQNVDRTIDSKNYGVSPCLTPNMIAFLTNRGGPIIGLEALALQGLPVDELLLTRESQDQMADLAGNAMSSTVVGAAILAALIVGRKVFKPLPEAEDVEMKIEEIVDVSTRIGGDSNIQEHPANFTSLATLNPGFLSRAHRSARKCECEGRTQTTNAVVNQCTTCGYSSCGNCPSKSEHNYVVDDAERISPLEFEAELRQVLPMRFKLDGFALDKLMKKVRELGSDGVPLDKKVVDKYMETIAAAVDGVEFHFRGAIRRRTWTAEFGSGHATFKLILDPVAPVWQLTVEPDVSLAVNDPLRAAMLHPIARRQLSPTTDSLIDGEWDISIPLTPQTLSISVEAVGEPVPSWRAEIGLVDFQNETRSNKLKVTVSPSSKAKEYLNRAVDGLYDLESHCGTATQSLHRRVEPAQAVPLYLFCDPTRSGEAFQDGYVFADNCERLDPGALRETIASTKPLWRPMLMDGDLVIEQPQTTSATFNSTFFSLPGSKITLNSISDDGSTIAMPSTALELSASLGACASTQCLLAASARLAKGEERPWTSEEWTQINILHDGPEVFQKLAWVLARLPEWSALKNWQGILPEGLHAACKDCCPKSPDVEWRRNKVGGIYGYENGQQAAQYEQALKARPAPILVHTRQVDDFFNFRIGLNVATLAHRALGSLPNDPWRRFKMDAPTVDWRLLSDEGLDLTLGKPLTRPTFHLPNNKTDKLAPQPPHFSTFPLRPEQLRSLTWMIKQETEPQVWVEQEVTETVLPSLNWHAEAKATRNVHVPGGVIADEVGYGKTAISIGLISSLLGVTPVPTDVDRINLKASFITVPGHLMKQWPKEINKFTDDALKILIVKNHGDARRATIQDYLDADVVLMSVTAFKPERYWADLGDWSASERGVAYDKNAGRYFRTCARESVDALGTQLDILRDPKRGPAEVLKRIQTARAARDAREDVPLEPIRRKGLLAASKDGKLLQAHLKKKQMEKAAKAKKAVEKKKRKQEREAEGLIFDEEEDDDEEEEDDEEVDLDAMAMDDDEVDKEPKKKVKPLASVDVDPWRLEEIEDAENWTEMKNPPLSLFSFQRMIIDEFTYLEPPQIEAVAAIRAANRWILSGTPPTESFDQIQTIATLLHVHLGVRDSTQGSAKATRGRTAEKTRAEEFHSFRDVHTAAWYHRRDEVAQRFLDQFARQNVAEIDEISYREEIIRIELPAPEMAIYRELEHHLLNADLSLTKRGKTKKSNESDRDQRVARAMGDSATPEEALLKACSHFTIDLKEIDPLDRAADVCDAIVNLRTEQLEDCREEVSKSILTLAAMHRMATKNGWYLGKRGGADADVQHFKGWLELAYKENDLRDAEAMRDVREMIEKANCSATTVGKTPEGVEVPGNRLWWLMQGLTETGKQPKKKPQPKTGVKALEEYRKQQIEYIRSAVTRRKIGLAPLVRELAGRYISRRYFQHVRGFQVGNSEYDGKALLSCCGHMGAVEEVEAGAKRGVCVVEGCHAFVRQHHVVKATDLGVAARNTEFGAKLERLIEIIDDIPQEDRILIFVQFPDLFTQTQECLESYGISVSTLLGNVNQSTDKLEAFQDPESTDKRVMLLLATDSSASGANLTVANWVIFLSPLLTNTLQDYRAKETQAIGRVRRYGQTKKVTVYRLLTRSTIDEKIYQERTGQIVDDVIAAQKAADPQSGVFAPTARDLNRIILRRGKKVPLESLKVIKPAELRKAKASRKAALKAKRLSGDNSDSDEEESEAEESDAPKSKKKAAPRKAPVKKAEKKAPVPKKAENVKKAPAKKTVAKKAAASTNSDSDDEPVIAKKPAAKAAPKRAIVLSDDDDDEEEEAEEAPSTSKKTAAAKPKPKSTVTVEPPAKKARVSTSNDAPAKTTSAPKASTSSSAPVKAPAKPKLPPPKPQAGRVVAGVAGTKMAPLFANLKRSAPTSEASTSSPAAGTKVPSPKRQKLIGVVIPYTNLTSSPSSKSTGGRKAKEASTPASVGTQQVESSPDV